MNTACVMLNYIYQWYILLEHYDVDLFIVMILFSKINKFKSVLNKQLSVVLRV